MKFFSIEGNVQKLDGGAMYGNAPREMWRTWSQPDETNRITLACRALLMEMDDGRNILFETGVGAFFDNKLKERFGISPKNHVLMDHLKEIGLNPEDIHAVVFSHLHFDHSGGALSASGDGEFRLVFPRARFYVGAEQWKRANDGHLRDKASFIPVLNDLLKKSERLVLVEKSGVSDFSGLVSFSFSNGHTPGLMISRISLNGGPLVFVSDLIPAVPWVHVPITMGYDRFPELLIDEKQVLLNDLSKSKGKLFFTHDPEIPCGAVKCDPKGRYFVEPMNLESLK